MPFAPTAQASEPVYTVDWLTDVLPRWHEALAPLHLLTAPRLLEIGAFEGRATRYLLDTFPTATITVIDPFTGGADQTSLQLDGLRARFEHNVSSARHRVRVLAEPSVTALPQLLAAGQSFDFIYVDGAHDAATVLFDAVCAWRLLAPRGRMCFDDFIWGADRVPDQFTPRSAILAFVTTHADQVRVIPEPDRQLWVERWHR